MERIKSFGSEKIKGVEWDLNRLLSCELLNDGELMLHVNYAKDLLISEKIRLFRNGFIELSRLLKNNPWFSSVQLITATSWIVAEHPKMMERLGFTIDNTSEDSIWHKNIYFQRKGSKNLDKMFADPDYAFISKEKFIELYDKQEPELKKYKKYNLKQEAA